VFGSFEEDTERTFRAYHLYVELLEKKGTVEAMEEVVLVRRKEEEREKKKREKEALLQEAQVYAASRGEEG